MWWILGIVAICVGAFVLMVFIGGRFLGKEYVGQVTAIIDLPVEDVWKAVNDFQTNPVSANMCRSVSKTQEDKEEEVWVEDIGSTQISVTVQSRTEHQLVRNMQDRIVPMTAVCTVQLESMGQSCQITAKNEITIEDGTWHVPVFRCVLYFFSGAKKGMKAYVKNVAKNLSTQPKFS